MGYSIQSILKEPHYLETQPAAMWKQCVWFGAFVFLFLLIFQPFGLNGVKDGLIAIVSGYGLITFGTMAILNVYVTRLFPSRFSEKIWTVGKEMGWVMVNLFFIGIANWVYSACLGIWSSSWSSFFRFQGYTLALGAFPVAISVLINQNRMKHKFKQQSDQLNPGLINHSKTTSSLIVIPSENKGEDMELPGNQVLFIRSSDNYVEVFFLTEKKITFKLIRNSLKNIAEALAEQSQFFRCHKSYLVNLDHVIHISGNAQGFKLHITDHDELIPVSRSYNSSIKKILKARETI